MNPHGLTDKARLRLHLRYAFHDWMWSGGSKDECGWRRRLARRLPTYFTDPYLDGIPKDPKKRMAWFDSLEPVETTGPPMRSLFVDFTTGKMTAAPQTWAATGTSWTYRQ